MPVGEDAGALANAEPFGMGCQVRIYEDWVGGCNPEVLLADPDGGEAGLVKEVGFFSPLFHEGVGRVAFEEVVEDVAVESQWVGLRREFGFMCVSVPEADVSQLDPRSRRKPWRCQVS